MEKFIVLSEGLLGYFRMDDLRETIKTYDDFSEIFINRYLENKEIIPFRNEFLSLVKGNIILDVGSGSGRDSKFFFDKGFEVKSIDLSEKMINFSSNYCKDVDFIKMDFNKLDFEDGFFDGLWVSSSIVHVKKENIENVIKEFYRVLKIGGVIFISFKPGNKEEFVKEDYLLGEGRFFAFYFLDELRKLLILSGFEIIKHNTLELNSNWNVIFARKIS